MDRFKKIFFLFVAFLALTWIPQVQAANLDFATAADMVKDYYHNQSEWAGIFRMTNIKRMVIEDDRGGKVAHVCYQYKAIPGNHMGRRDSGVDQRTFTFGMVRGGYRVLDMGPYQSTDLGC
ncbi:MAG: hypothetical protein G8345_08895 [Magnetococcales bacterium]|nr:hypothetical protein [Magnetococcales bacterium]NGZ26992.1 hypothetical protein [Magnetococcales bacterium]